MFPLLLVFCFLLASSEAAYCGVTGVAYHVEVNRRAFFPSRPISTVPSSSAAPGHLVSEVATHLSMPVLRSSLTDTKFRSQMLPSGRADGFFRERSEECSDSTSSRASSCVVMPVGVACVDDRITWVGGILASQNGRSSFVKKFLQSAASVLPVRGTPFRGRPWTATSATRMASDWWWEKNVSKLAQAKFWT